MVPTVCKGSFFSTSHLPFFSSLVIFQSKYWKLKHLLFSASNMLDSKRDIQSNPVLDLKVSVYAECLGVGRR